VTHLALESTGVYCETGHQILEIAFYIMRDGATYDELGADYFNRRNS
jgi:hypothetical protein